ncbi:helix-turn-helix domain-containing protein [Brevibacillus reuszeri]|uniref:helix-turn-helix domain-containing protein n=1 Tax=Brevibacillus reuszeri TaxID=54915 RepID=UPI00289A147F|nr:helix-turn-helix domain-containing protein [Brevibacillus reuszeri]
MTQLDQVVRDIVRVEVEAAEKRILVRMSYVSDRTLSFAEACEYLHMSEYTLRRLCREKRIPHRTYGADGSKNPRYLFSTASLDRWIRDQEEANYRPGGGGSNA